MDDKVVLVTGSSAGIGEATVLSFAKLGCKVVVHGTDEARIKKVASKCSEISPKGYKYYLKPLEVAADLKDEKQVEKLVELVLGHYSKLDILVNNAGAFKTTHVTDADSFEIFNDLMRINLNSVVQLTTLLIPHLKQTRGNIVNISSNLHQKCIEGGFAYCTSKAALTMFSKSIAVDLAPTVRVNSVSPGPVATLLPIRFGLNLTDYRKSVGEACLVERVGEPEEIARLVVFLASPDSAFVTGSDFIVDGGSSLKPSGKVVGQN